MNSSCPIGNQGRDNSEAGGQGETVYYTQRDKTFCEDCMRMELRARFAERLSKESNDDPT